MSWKRKLILWTLGLAAGGAVLAQQANSTSELDYSFFKIIPDRNIFNPNRISHRPGTRRIENTRPAPVDGFTLVGTLSYAKGSFAFFDGSNPDYQKVLERDGTIAGFKISAIEPNAVVLDVGDKPVEMKIGAQMRRDEGTNWQLVAQGEPLPLSAEKTEAVSVPAAATPSIDDAGDQSDVLKKLMQQREEELK